MPNVQCPNCQISVKLPKPKPGKFKLECKSCKQTFRLLIQERSDGSFRFKTALRNTKTAAAEINTDRGSDQRLPFAGDANKHIADQNQIHPLSPRQSQDRPVVAKPDAAKPDAANRLATTNEPSGPDAQSRPLTSNDRLGPYRLIKLLGEGGMGSVFLANQTSLDREVALKVLKNHLSGNPAMLARFTREAYAAAQLIHPNVVQIYDMGDDHGNSYFSMELVDGCSLRQLIQDNKQLDPKEAAGYILQAARGLQCAHDAGMVHRDVKPSNLLVNQDGLLKVADLGLVQVPNQAEIDDSEVDQMVALSASQDLTRVGAKIGTPYYMAPEQAKTAAVDHRADIYSLGCTFYVLLTGNRPFDGRSVQEVIVKHSSEPLVLPSQVVDRVPGRLSQIVAKMMAKRPEDRYQNMGEIVEQLQGFLGIKSSDAFSPDEADAIEIDAACRNFNSTENAKVRRFIPSGLILVSILFATVSSIVSWKLSTGFMLMPVFALAAYFIICGLISNSVLFNQCRELIYRGGVSACLKWAVASILLVVASFLVGTLTYWVFTGILGVGLGIGYYFLIDVAITKARRTSVAKAESLLRRLRVDGQNESTIQNFVAKYSPQDWEEFFETLFGYEAKRLIRDRLAALEANTSRRKFRAWRYGIYDRLADHLDAFATQSDRKHLRQIEEAGLVAAGVSIQDARSQASQIAEAIVDNGDAIRIAQLEKRLAKADPKFEREQQRAKIKAMLADARSGKYKRAKSSLSDRSIQLDRFLGATPRLLLGCCLIVGSLLWARQNDLLLSVEQLQEIGEQSLVAVRNQDAANEAVEAAKAEGQILKQAILAKETKLLWGLFYSFDSLIAGLVLLLSTVVFGWRISIFVIPAAIVAMVGPALGVPDFLAADVSVPHLNATTAIIALGLLSLGIVFGRRED